MKVWVNGTFDVLHIGHIKLLEYAASFGQLRVGIDTDERVRSLKGNTRPVNKLEDRKGLLKALRCVDSVVEFASREELTDQIKEWRPDIMVVGDDYLDKEVIGSEWARELVFFKKIQGYSTTNILNHDKDNSSR